MGFEVIHHPRIGGRQAGVDVAAVGPDMDANDRQTLLLFVIKSGDVGRGTGMDRYRRCAPRWTR